LREKNEEILNARRFFSQAPIKRCFIRSCDHPAIQDHPSTRMPHADAAPLRAICHLEHPIFSRLGDILFRRSLSDGTPLMIQPFGSREAGLPLRSLQRAFGITDESPDGQMLGQIAESLDYVVCLRPGDPLPGEVVTGRASWEPSAAHRRRAVMRLRLRLLAWLDPEAARAAGAMRGIEARMQTDPAIRGKIQAAFREAAVALDVAGSEAVVALLARIGEELAFIEALRERLLMRVPAWRVRIRRIIHKARRADPLQHQDVTQVLRLGDIALAGFKARFADVDAQTGDIIAMLRNADGQIAYIRSTRDTLYRSLRAWEPVLDAWRTVDPSGAAVRGMVASTYHFLAQRYLPASEWPLFNARREKGALRQQGAPRPPGHRMIW